MKQTGTLFSHTEDLGEIPLNSPQW